MIRDDSKLIQSQHLINPHQKTPIIGEKTFTVMAQSCAVADALTKALAVDQDIHAPYFDKLGARAYVLEINHPTPV
jgi:thiamine biosynthesis lipoprotein